MRLALPPPRTLRGAPHSLTQVEARNALENYAYGVRGTLRSEPAAKALGEEECGRLGRAVDAALQWLESNGLAEVDEIEHQQKELEGVCGPAIARMYQQQQQGGAGASAGAAAAAPGGRSSGPTVEEVD